MSNQPQPCKLLSFNIRGAWREKEPNGNTWKNRRQLAFDVIKRNDPDVFGLQECIKEVWEEWTIEFPSYASNMGPAYRQDPPSYYPALFWKKSRFELMHASYFWVSPTPDRFSISWEGGVTVTHWIQLLDKITQNELYVLNTHFHSTAKDKCIHCIIEHMQSLGFLEKPAALMGDFNLSPQTKLHAALVSAGLSDAFLQSGKQDAPGVYTTHEFCGTLDPPREYWVRKDWIFCSSPFKATDFLIDTTGEPPLFPSDHFPIMATVCHSH